MYVNIYATLTLVICSFGLYAAVVLPETRIIGGQESHIVKYPFEVSVRRKDCSGCAFEHYCSGTIISTRFIMTSANCVRDATPHVLHIVAGTSLRSNAAKKGSVYPVERIILHEERSIDIAMLELALEITLNNFNIMAVTLATELPRAGKMASVAGWGQLEEFGGFSETLLEVRVPIIEHKVCEDFYFWSAVTEYELCAGFPEGGADTCQGDAGSPLLVDDQMVGFVSWGYGCARPGNPGVYTNVVKLSNWIAEQVQI